MGAHVCIYMHACIVAAQYQHSSFKQYEELAGECYIIPFHTVTLPALPMGFLLQKFAVIRLLHFK